MKTITRQDINQALSRNILSVSGREVAGILEMVIDTMKRALIERKEIKISNFGTFRIYHKRERMGRNPKTLEEALISARSSVHFRPSKALKDHVNRGLF